MCRASRRNSAGRAIRSATTIAPSPPSSGPSSVFGGDAGRNDARHLDGEPRRGRRGDPDRGPDAGRGSRSHPRQDRTVPRQGRALRRSGHSGALATSRSPASPAFWNSSACRCFISATFSSATRYATCFRSSASTRSIGNVGLVRVAALPEYQVTRDDALAVIRWAQAQPSVFTRRSTRVRKSMVSATPAAPARPPRQPAPGSRQCLALDASHHLALRAQRLSAAAAARWRREGAAKTGRDLSSAQGLRRTGRARRFQPEGASSTASAASRRSTRIPLPRWSRPRPSDMDAVRVMTIHGSKGLNSAPSTFRRWPPATCRPPGKASAARRRRPCPARDAAGRPRGRGGMPLLRRACRGRAITSR